MFDARPSVDPSKRARNRLSVRLRAGPAAIRRLVRRAPASQLETSRRPPPTPTLERPCAPDARQRPERRLDARRVARDRAFGCVGRSGRNSSS